MPPVKYTTDDEEHKTMLLMFLNGRIHVLNTRVLANYLFTYYSLRASCILVQNWGTPDPIPTSSPAYKMLYFAVILTVCLNFFTYLLTYLLTYLIVCTTFSSFYRGSQQCADEIIHKLRTDIDVVANATNSSTKCVYTSNSTICKQYRNQLVICHI